MRKKVNGIEAGGNRANDGLSFRERRLPVLCHTDAGEENGGNSDGNTSGAMEGDRHGR